MGPQAYERKLTAVLSADVEVYSRLMGEDKAEEYMINAGREAMSVLFISEINDDSAVFLAKKTVPAL